MSKPFRPSGQLTISAKDFGRYAGYQAIPLHKPDTVRTIKGKTVRIGKRPLDFNWTTRAYKTAEVIKRCVADQRNMGVRLRSTDLVLDMDLRHGGVEGLEDLCMDAGLDLSKYPRVVTGSGGLHLYGQKPADLLVVDTLPAYPGVEFKSKGRQVVAAGSVHPDTRKLYRFDDAFPALNEAPEWPEALIDLIRRPERSGEAVGGGQYTQEQLAKALDKLDVEDFRAHDEWLRLMMACHAATNGDARPEFVEWSTSDPNYSDDAEIIGRRWDSLHSEKPGGVTYRTLNAILADHGAANETVASDAAADFEGAALDPEHESDFEKQPILKLNDVNVKNIDGLFRVVNLNGKMRVVWWARSALDQNVRTPQFWSIAEFKTALVNKFCIRPVKKTNAKGEETESTIRIPLSHYFLSNPKRYTFDGVVLNPEIHSDSPDAINLWRGYGVEENESGDWSLLREHIRKVIANGKKDRYDYIIKWIAWALQNPADPCEVALILKSATHGTGKGMVLRTIRKLFGAHAMQISKGGLLTGRFNAHLAMTCFLFVDEMTLADNKESATLNSTLTEDAIPIEPKGVDAYMMPNHVKVAAASNQEHVVLVAGSDRRFMIFEVSDKHARDIPYFTAISDQLEQGGYGGMLHDLLAMDLAGWHPRNTAGCSDDKDPEKIESAPPEVQWLAGYLDSGVLDWQVPERAGGTVYAGKFYEHARKTVRALAGWTDNSFASFLKEWKVKRRISHGSQWTFPPLADMRAAFEAKYPWWPAFDNAITEWEDTAEADEDRDDFG